MTCGRIAIKSTGSFKYAFVYEMVNNSNFLIIV